LYSPGNTMAANFADSSKFEWGFRRQLFLLASQPPLHDLHEAERNVHHDPLVASPTRRQALNRSRPRHRGQQHPLTSRVYPPERRTDPIKPSAAAPSCYCWMPYPPPRGIQKSSAGALDPNPWSQCWGSKDSPACICPCGGSNNMPSPVGSGSSMHA
jgi:hypothetical protein